MLSFDFKKSSRKCSQSDREFASGEEFYSALLETNEGTERNDYSQEHWEGPPENCIGWWKSRMPERGKGKIYWAPRDVLVSYFEHVLGQPNSQDIAFVVALLLIQKKIMAEYDDGIDDSVIQLRNNVSKADYKVPVMELEPQRLNEIQKELAQRLFMDEPVDPDSHADEVTDVS